MKAYYYSDDPLADPEEREIPEELQDQAQQLRDDLVEAVAELDDDLMLKYLEGEEITIDELKAGIRQATLDVEFYPVFAGSAFQNKGVRLLLDGVVDYLPAPTDIPPIEGIVPGTEEKVKRISADDQPFSALAFKVMSDPYVGKLTFFRVYSGTLDAGSYVQNTVKNERERVGRILQMHANSREEISTIHCGEIAAAVGLRNTATGETLCDPDHPVILESMDFPEPVISVAIEPKTKADQDRMGQALSRLAEEDPTFVTETNEET